MIFSVPKTSLIATLFAVQAFAGCTNIAGNYYCGQVQQVIYESIGFSGSYQQVTNFDLNSCSCSQQPKAFSGNLSPLDEELSVHFRGPLKLKQFAFYSYNATKGKRDAEPEVEVAKRHEHHNHNKRDAVVYVTEVITVNGPAPTGGVSIDAAAAAAPPAAAAPAAPAAPYSPPAGGSTGAGPAAPAAPAPPTSSAAPVANGAGWTRQSYYNSASGSASGLTFLNNMGGTAGSGVWDTCFGNSLSYCNADGVTGAGAPTVLSDVTIPSNKEFVIFSGDKCVGDSCGYYRPGTPAYHGFGGNFKVFAFEFGMPSDPGAASSFNGDMPAIWMLNAQIPRTVQYGNSKCSCWDTGCGEFDVFEVLNSGNNFLTSHLHTGQNGGASGKGGAGTGDYIARPTSGTMKAAVIFSDSSITITVLDDSTTFDGFVSDATLQQWIAQGAKASSSVQL